MTNSDLARGAFVTRQSMNVLLQALQRDGLVSRPTHASSGRALPAELTVKGRMQLKTATAAVRAIEIQMLAGITDRDRELCFRALRQMISYLKPSMPVG
jgi:DNA-binding MarR family transcriptional regulator